MQEHDKLAHETIVEVHLDNREVKYLGFGNQPGHRARANEQAAHVAIHGLCVPCAEGSILFPVHRISHLKIVSDVLVLKRKQCWVDVAI